MNIRYATMADLDDIASVESECFPVLEAATKEEFEQRKILWKSFLAYV